MGACERPRRVTATASCHSSTWLSTLHSVTPQTASLSPRTMHGHNECSPLGKLSTVTADLIRHFDAAIRRDPAHRGLISSELKFGPLCAGHLGAAATHLARNGKRVAIVTGFYIPGADPPAAETDGPPGALVLAQALHSLGVETIVVTDAFCFGALAAGAHSAAYPGDRLVCYPNFSEVSSADGSAAAWRSDFFSRGTGKELSHLIAVERVGPSHSV